MPRSERLYLTDIIDSAEAITRMIGSRSRAEFLADEVLRRAVLQALIEIGEATSRLSGPFRARHPDIEWADIVAFRNFAVHAYFAVDWDIVWVTAVRNAPVVARLVTAILEDEYPSPPPSTDQGSPSSG